MGARRNEALASAAAHPPLTAPTPPRCRHPSQGKGAPSSSPSPTRDEALSPTAPVPRPSPSSCAPPALARTDAPRGALATRIAPTTVVVLSPIPHRHLLGGEVLPVVVARFSSPPPALTTRVTRGDGSCPIAAAALIDVKVGRVVFRVRRPTARVRLLECEMSRVHP